MLKWSAEGVFSDHDRWIVYWPLATGAPQTPRRETVEEPEWNHGGEIETDARCDSVFSFCYFSSPLILLQTRLISHYDS
jgi:hypothetical protein